MKTLKYLFAAVFIILIYTAFYFAIYWIAEYCLRTLI